MPTVCVGQSSSASLITSATSQVLPLPGAARTIRTRSSVRSRTAFCSGVGFSFVVASAIEADCLQDTTTYVIAFSK